MYIPRYNSSITAMTIRPPSRIGTGNKLKIPTFSDNKPIHKMIEVKPL